MIKNERQYKVTKGQIAKLTGALEIAARDRDRMDRRVHEAMVAGIQSDIGELRSQLREYEKLKAGVRRLRMESFTDLPRVLIAGRIGRGLSQKDLAKKLGVKPQQVQKDEKTDYRSASLHRILDVIEALNLHVDASVELTKGDEGKTG